MRTMLLVRWHTLQCRAQNLPALRLLKGGFTPGDAVVLDFRDGVPGCAARAAAPAPGSG
jgi:hypothetical protein